MASQSDSPPNSVNENTQNPATASQSAAEDHQDSKPEAARGSSTASVFVNSEPIREDQVQNAMKFLSHPKVRGSPVIYRRSFLERKGLTKEEIDEAFRRVPDPTPTATSTQPVAANEDGKQKPSSTSPPQAALQNLQPASAPSNTMTKTGYLSHFHWTHAAVAVGLLAGTAVLFKISIIPRLKSWIRKVVMDEEDEKGIVKGKPSLTEEAVVAAKVVAAAAADVARASQEMLASKSQEKKYFEEMTSLLNYQVREMKSMTNAIEQTSGSPAAPVQKRPTQRSWVPPQPPPVAMAEAAPAISEPKKPAFQNEQLTDDQLTLARSSEITDELHKVTKISESGGSPEANGSSSSLQMSGSDTN